MHTFRMRLTWILVLFIGLTVLISGVFMARLLERSQLDAIKEHRQRELSIILAAIDWKQDGSLQQRRAYFTEQALKFKKETDARLTFIGANGVVLGDSDHDANTMENHLQREEMTGALQEGFGYATRFSETIGEKLLYVAIPHMQFGQNAGFARLSISLEEVDDAVERLWQMLIAGLVLLFLIAAFISFRVAHRLTEPLVHITEVAKRISRLEVDARVDVQSRDEIGQLGKAINTMADSLKRQVGRIVNDENRLKSVLEHMASGVLMVDAENKVVLLNPSAERIVGHSASAWVGSVYTDLPLEQDVRRLMAESMNRQTPVKEEMVLYFPEEHIVEVHAVPMFLPNGEWAGAVVFMHDITSFRHLEKVRSEFIANVSHELKTPITAVKGFAETLLNGALQDPETAKSFLQIIYEESNRLHRLISDILELSQIESKQIALQSAPIHLNSFIQQTLQTLENQADQKSIRLRMHLKEELVLEADEDLLRQILINLISNGIAYTPDHGQVEVSAEPVYEAGEDDYVRVRIKVADTGMGIPKKDLPRVFERFYRVDKGRSRRSGGTGLGLSIVKHLVELHRGTVKVESELDVGTTFTLELPVIQ